MNHPIISTPAHHLSLPSSLSLLSLILLIIITSTTPITSSVPQCYKPISTTSGKGVCVIYGNLSQPIPISSMCEVECAYRCRSDPISMCVGYNCRYASCEMVYGDGGPWQTRYVNTDPVVTGCCRFYSTLETWGLALDIILTTTTRPPTTTTTTTPPPTTTTTTTTPPPRATTTIKTYDCLTNNPCQLLTNAGKRFPHINSYQYVECSALSLGLLSVGCSIGTCSTSFNAQTSACN